MEGAGRPHIIILTSEITWRVCVTQKSLLAQWTDREHSGENQKAPGMAVAQAPLGKRDENDP